jgi:hypothetical protein
MVTKMGSPLTPGVRGDPIFVTIFERALRESTYKHSLLINALSNPPGVKGIARKGKYGLSDLSNIVTKI